MIRDNPCVNADQQLLDEGKAIEKNGLLLWLCQLGGEDFIPRDPESIIQEHQVRPRLNIYSGNSGKL